MRRVARRLAFLCLYAIVFCISFHHSENLRLVEYSNGSGERSGSSSSSGDASFSPPLTRRGETGNFNDTAATQKASNVSSDHKASNHSTSYTSSSVQAEEEIRPITLTLPKEQQQWILHERNQSFFERWWNNAIATPTGKRFKKNADRIISTSSTTTPILDFVIAGFSKCGTSTVMANLAQVTPMPLKDVCHSAESIVKDAYGAWNEEYGNSSTKFLKGSKCPRYVGSDLDKLQGFSDALPQTKLIIGIRHPVLWFQSFWKMVGNGKSKDGSVVTPNERMTMCPCAPDQYGKRACQVNYAPINAKTSTQQQPSRRHRGCINECDGGMIFCLARTRFHVALAQLGKTTLSTHERRLLAPKDVDGGNNLQNMKIRNPIFLYEQTMLRNESTWDEMASSLGLSHIPNTKYQDSKGKQFSEANICLPEYDYLRSQIMLYSHDLSEWMIKYFLPVARDRKRTDVTIANIDAFETKVTTTYKEDPCRRLIRVNAEDGSVAYVLNPSLNETMWIPSPRIANTPSFEKSILFQGNRDVFRH